MQSPQHSLPEGFAAAADRIVTEVDDIEGFLSPMETRFLILLGAVPTSAGEILEIGSFKGRSTVVLARSSMLAGDELVNAVDPMNAPSSTDPDLGEDESSFDDFSRNTKRHGVASRIRLHRMLSTELAETWTKPIRLLWIDGDHTYEGTRLDLESFEPFLEDGAIVAMHDVLHEFDGGIKVFMEHILRSPHYGISGFCGSIGWSRYHSDPDQTAEHRGAKEWLYKRLSRLLPYVATDRPLTGLRKKIYKLHRSRVPHRPIDPAQWCSKIH